MNETIGVAHTCEHEWHLFAQKFKYLALNRFPMHHCLSSIFVALPKTVTQVIKLFATLSYRVTSYSKELGVI